jgi:hypothetical protein
VTDAARTSSGAMHDADDITTTSLFKRRSDVVIKPTKEALQKASAWYYVARTAHLEQQQDGERQVAQSFPYVVHDLICVLKELQH